MKRPFVSHKDVSVRLFKNDFLESLTKVHPSTPLVIFIPAIFYFIYKSFPLYSHSLLFLISLVLAGLFAWTFVEYFIHRFIFHLTFENNLIKKIHFLFHGIHHDYPQDSRRLVMPPSVSIPLATLMYFIFKTFVPENRMSPFFAGFLIGYLLYDMLHFAIHHFQVRGKFWQLVKTHHLKHHYYDHEHGYGVSTPLWDLILNTQFVSANKAEIETSLD